MAEKTNTIDPRVLQEYMDSLAHCRDNPDRKMAKRDLMRAYLELQFRLNGGSRCAICSTHVRHVMPIICERASGEVRSYECLCTRCFEGEKSASRRVHTKLGEAKMYFEANGDVSFDEPGTDTTRS